MIYTLKTILIDRMESLGRTFSFKMIGSRYEDNQIVTQFFKLGQGLTTFELEEDAKRFIAIARALGWDLKGMEFLRDGVQVILIYTPPEYVTESEEIPT
jgi:hypothetical protein